MTQLHLVAGSGYRAAVDPMRVPWPWRLALAVIRRSPQAAISRLAGRVADVPIPRLLRKPVLAAFARCVGADPVEAAGTWADYPTVDAFFTRKLAPGRRPLPADPAILVSPVDGQVAASGAIHDGTAFQVKGLAYEIGELLGDPTEAAALEGGWFLTVYLSPRDYHRIHAPAGGQLLWAGHEPGRLLPVNPPAAALIPDLFARNERVVCCQDSARGRIVTVAVGAIDVGRISTTFDPVWSSPRGGVTNRRGASPTRRTYDPPVDVERGQELMTFHLGSTVVVLVGPEGPPPRTDLARGTAIRMGAAVSS